jgi:hypothetical protein
VVEASHHSLNAKNVGPGKRTARECPVYSFLFREAMPSSRLARRKPAHASSAFTGPATLPMQRPYEVK